MAKSRDSYKKRMKELAWKEKKDQKRQRKLDKKIIKAEENPNQSKGFMLVEIPGPIKAVFNILGNCGYRTIITVPRDRVPGLGDRNCG